MQVLEFMHQGFKNNFELGRVCGFSNENLNLSEVYFFGGKIAAFLSV